MAPRIRNIYRTLDEQCLDEEIPTSALPCAYHITDAFSPSDLEKIDALRQRIPLDVSRPTCPRRFLTEKKNAFQQQHQEDGWVGALIDATLASWNLSHALVCLPWYRFLEYTEPGGHMKIHTDGSNVHPDTGARSVATMLLYLSTCRRGGETALYRTKMDIMEKVSPVYNTALIFPHGWQHSGEPIVEDNPKIVLRIDLALRPTKTSVHTAVANINRHTKRNKAQQISASRDAIVRGCCSLVEGILMNQLSGDDSEQADASPCESCDWTTFEPAFLSMFQGCKFVEREPQALDWNALPPSLRPESGQLNPERASNKEKQVEALLQYALPLVDHLYDQNNQQTVKIVEFGAGSGHLGLLLAFLKKSRCTVTLLDRKQFACQQAQRRARDASLDNVTIANTSIHEFAKYCSETKSVEKSVSFHLGIALHSCGVLTDAALALCLKRRAAFCLCPCCYGQTASNLPPDYLPRSDALQVLHTMSIPQQSAKGRRRRGKLLKAKPFTMVARSADCTSAVESFVESTNFRLAKRCMQIVDSDRLLWVAQHQYDVHMSSLRPLETTPKNNLIIGVPHAMKYGAETRSVDLIALAASAGENVEAETGERAKTGLEQFRHS